MSNFILTGFGDEIAPDLGTQLSVMAKNDMHFIELRNVDGKSVAEYTPVQAQKIKNQLDAAGFKVSSIGSPIGKIGIEDNFDAHLDLFKNTLEISQILESPYIRIFSFYIPENGRPEDYRDEVMNRLNRLCEEAEDCPVRLLHENELGIYGDTPERCLDIIENLGYKRIGAIFDPANFINHRDLIEVYPYAWHLLKKYVDYMHIKDALHEREPKTDAHRVRPAGYGEGRIEDILRELYTGGYDGFLSVEPHLGYFEGFDRLGKHIVDENIPKGGPQTFTVATNALKEIVKVVTITGKKE
jgi:sugar phosphate isomerase/epimerase